MKKIVLVLLITVQLILNLSSCSLLVDYTVYSSTALDSDEVNASIDFKESSEIEFVSISLGESFERNGASEEKKFNINNREIELSYYKSKINEYNSSKTLKLQDNGIVDIYLDETNTNEIKINPATNHLLMFTNKDSSVYAQEGDLTEESAKEIAKDFIVSAYGDDITKTHEFESATRVNSSYPVEIGYVVIFRRYIHGYKTDDFLRIRINLQGEIYSVWAANVDVYDSANIKVSKYQLERAEKKLLSALETDNRKITSDEQRIRIDADGTVYLEASVAYYVDGEFSHGDVCYINVN